LFDEISEELVKALQANLKYFPAEAIRRSPPSSKLDKFPTISIQSADFVLEEAGLGGGESIEKDVAEERFSGDGKNKEFKLAAKPERPLLRVESPLKAPKSEPEDYEVDYSSGTVRFLAAPEAGKDNVIVKYYSASSAGALKSVRLNVNYHIDVWATDEVQRDHLTIEVIKALMVSQEGFSSRGIRVKPLQGLNIEPDSQLAGTSAKRLVCEVEAELKVRMPVARIEKIALREVKPEDGGVRASS